MKRIINLALLLLASVTASELQAEPNEVSLDFSQYLHGPAKWQLGGDNVISLKMDDDATVFLDAKDKEIFRLRPPEYIKQALLSEDGKSLVLIAMKNKGRGSDYVALVRVTVADAGLKVTRLLESRQKLFASRWWLAELGAISNDGTKILAKFGVEYPEATGFRMDYKWYTIALPSGEILSEGLSIANSKAPARK